MQEPELELPAYATQVGGIIRVGSIAQALDVLDYIPKEYDHMFSVSITDRTENHTLGAITRALGIAE